MFSVHQIDAGSMQIMGAVFKLIFNKKQTVNFNDYYFFLTIYEENENRGCDANVYYIIRVFQLKKVMKNYYYYFFLEYLITSIRIPILLFLYV